MWKTYRYLMIPIDQVRTDATYPVWFGMWSKDTKTITWSRNRPDVIDTWAVAVSPQELSPDGATTDLAAINLADQDITVLGEGTKDPPPPPLRLSSPDFTAFRDAFNVWLTARSA